VQVADRFHLAKNVGDALGRVLQRHRAALRQAAAQPAVAADHVAASPGPTIEPARAPVADVVPTTYQRERQPLYDAMARLAAAAWSKAAIARQLGVSIPTVRAYLLAGGPPDLMTRGPKPGACRGDHEAYLRERWRAGCHDGKALWGELRDQGYRGSLRTVQRLVAGWRAPGEPRRGKRPAGLPTAPLPPPRAPSTRQVRWWLLRPSEEGRPAREAFLTPLLARCPEIAAAATLAGDFLALLRGRDQAALGGWLDRAAASDVPEFRELAAGLARNLQRRGGAHDGLEQRAGRRAGERAEAGEARDVRACRLPRTPTARARRGVSGPPLAVTLIVARLCDTASPCTGERVGE